MRETRFFSFDTAPSAVDAPGVHLYDVPSVAWSGIVVPRVPPRPQVAAGGLAGGFFAWRVVDGDKIVVEHVVERVQLLIALPGAVVCPPAVTAHDLTLRVVAAFQHEGSACEVVHLHATFAARDADAPLVQRAQNVIDADVVSCLLASDASDTCFYGTLGGQCGLIEPQRDTLLLRRFDAPAHSAERTADDESVSMTSDTSRRSFTSAATPSLFSRLLATPRNLLPTPNASNTPETPGMWQTPRSNRASRTIFTTPRSSRRSASIPLMSTTERIDALQCVDIGEPCLVVLHGSGRISGFLQMTPNEFRYAGDTHLGLTLASDHSRNLLLEAAREQLAAVLTVDEEPQANSVRVFRVDVKLRGTRNVNLSCRQVVKRSGPIERVVAAVVLGGEVIVGTETGVISGPLSGSTANDNGIGLPGRLLWTAIEEIEQSTGLGKCVNELIQDPRERLLAAHRYSVAVISKALRFTNVASRAVLEKHVREMNLGEETNTAFAKALARCDFLCIDTDLKLFGMQNVPGVGIVVARSCGLSVFRPLFVDEKSTIGVSFPSYTEFQNELSGPIAWLAASHGSAQIFVSALPNSNADPNALGRRFMTEQALRYSQLHKHFTLTDVVIADRAKKELADKISGEPHQVTLFADAIRHVQCSLQPGGESLCFLFDAGEMEALYRLAMHCGDSLPVSSYFTSGLCWLHRLSSLGDDAVTVDEQMNGLTLMGDDDEGEPKTSGLTRKQTLEKAYGLLVSAAKMAASSDGPGEEDVNCVIHIAGIETNKAESARDDDMRDEAADSPVSGMEDDPVVDNLAYWILERAVHQFEKVGSPKNAAAAALEAMQQAPSRELYESMRSAAFGRFLDAKNLKTALDAMLKPPYHKEPGALVTKSEASALRDGMALFVNAVAEDGMMKWLVERDLPEPLKSLTSITLERRARAAEPFDVDSELASIQLAPDEASSRKKYEYEYVFAWHVRNKIHHCAAAIALEWGERLSNEGLKLVLQASFPNSVSLHETQLKLFLAWANRKLHAYSFAHAAVQSIREEDRRYFVRSRFSVAGQNPQKPTSGVVAPEWAGRRNLLAKTQAMVIGRMLSESEELRKVQHASFLMGTGSSCLADDNNGVTWAVQMLCSVPSLENVRFAAELAASWIEENGTEQLQTIVKSAATEAVRGSSHLDFDSFGELLIDVYNMAAVNGLWRNWSLIGLEAALGELVDDSEPPQWLIDQAAWGVQKENHDPFMVERIESKGDVAGVARAFLKCGRPKLAARVLLMELQRAEGRDTKRSKKMGIPYAAIDATLVAFGRIEEEDQDAQYLYDQLKERCEQHFESVKKEQQKAKDEWNATRDTVMC